MVDYVGVTFFGEVGRIGLIYMGMDIRAELLTDS